MKNLVSLVLFAFLSTGAFAQATWNVDKAHSQVSFEVIHMGIASIEGQFGEFEASITSSKEDFSDAVYDVTIDVNSIYTGVEMRDNHLRSGDFFEVETYPTMTFKSTKVEETGEEGKFKVTGDLTFHGVTKPITLDVWHRGTIDGKNGEKIAGFRVTGSIDRSDFNFGTGFSGALSEEVQIEVDGEFKKA